MADEQSLNYFHGALLDEDVDKLLVNEGDFLLQSKYDSGHTRLKLVLAVKKNRIRRFELTRVENGIWLLERSEDCSNNEILGGCVRNPLKRFSLQGKLYSNVKMAIEHFQNTKLDMGNGEMLYLKRAVPKSKYQLGHKDIRLQRKIGSGAYGTVYKGILCKDMRPVAVKRIDSDGKNEQGLIDMMKEARVMQMYNHINIVKFYGFIVDRTPYLLVMELCQDGSVEDKLRSAGRSISISLRVNYCAQAAAGLEYLHTKNCIHRDIATRNCLLSGKVLKLADFGMCRATVIYKIDLRKPQNVRWLAPEVWKTGETKICTDVYAFGIMLWEMFEQPYNSPYCNWKAITVKERVMIGYRMPTPAFMPDQMATIMRRCWDQEPDKRPTAAEARRNIDLINKEFNDEDECHLSNMPITKITSRARSNIIAVGGSLLRNNKFGYDTRTARSMSMASTPVSSRLSSPSRSRTRG